MDFTLMDQVDREEEGTNHPFAGEVFSNPGPGLRLYFYGGSHDKTQAFIDRAGEYLLGRSKESAFRFSDANRTDVNVSRKHAFLRVDATSVILVNQTPRNGLILNGIPLADYQEVALNDTDVITLGGNGPNIRVRIGDLSSLREDSYRHGEENGR